MNIKLNDNEFSKIITKWGDIKEWVNFEEIDALLIKVCINQNIAKTGLVILSEKSKTTCFLEAITNIIDRETKSCITDVIDKYLVGIVKGDNTFIEFDNFIFSYYTNKNRTSGGEGVVNVEKKHIIN